MRARLCTWEAMADSRCVLGSAAGTRVQSAWRHDQTPAGACLWHGTAMKLRLIVQACDCSLGARRRRTRGAYLFMMPAREYRVLAATTRHLQVRAFATEPP